MDKFSKLVKITKESSATLADSSGKYMAISTAVLGGFAVIAGTSIHNIPKEFLNPDFIGGVLRASKIIIDNFLDPSRMASHSHINEIIDYSTKNLSIIMEEQQKVVNNTVCSVKNSKDVVFENILKFKNKITPNLKNDNKIKIH